LRSAFAKALIQAAQSDPNILLLTGDHGYSLFDEFRRVCLPQYLNAGVAEQNMVGVAAGLAKAGFKPIVYGLSAFVPIRVLEQIKIDICYENLPVIFIGDGAGIVYSTLGTSHQSAEDVAALRALPNMKILSPADSFEMTACMVMALSCNSPVYVRMGKADLAAVHTSAPDLGWGEPYCLREGLGPLAWLATGSMVSTALRVSESWPDSPVWSLPCIKPLHAEPIADICRRHKAIITLEEHSVLGGLGSAVAEIAAAWAPTWICRIGIQDRFSKYCGNYQYLLKEHELDDAGILKQVELFLDRHRISGKMRLAKKATAGMRATA
jgi:transketolase